MSWLSKAKNAFLNLVTGKPADTNIVTNPTTPLEHAINAGAAVLLPAASMVPGASSAAVPIEAISAVVNTASHPASIATSTVPATLGAVAANAVNSYTQKQLGNVGQEMTDAGLQALAATAIAGMSGNTNKTVEEIDAALEQFMSGFSAAQPEPPTPASNGEQTAA